MADPPATAVERPARSVRHRLLAIALLPMLVILPLLLGVTIYRWDAKFDAMLISKVNGDLTIAHQYLSRILENTGEHIEALGGSARYRDVAASSRLPLDLFLSESKKRLELDFLYVIDADGNVLASAAASTQSMLRNDWPVIVSAIDGRSSTAIDIFAHTDLNRLSPDLAARARLPLVNTPNAQPTDRKEESRGMVIHSASPISIEGGRKAILVGGILLNQNLLFIDTINDLVYREASLPAGSQGTATLFLDDVRISTNVRLFEDRRALGTRVSRAVRSAVLEHGRIWLDSAFVVNDWYISAYEPLVDSHGNRVGMLYVGFLQAPFTAAKIQTVLTIAIAFLTIAAASVPIFLRWAQGIFQPLERMNATIAKVESGDLRARTGPVDSRDEIGRVAVHLDNLLDQIEQRDQELRQWNQELNTRVDERTRELQLANRRLEATTKQLIMSEKLAAIGEITAGVAHEINNPIAVMQGNLEVIRSVIGEHAELASTEFQLLDEQIRRISQIVTKLLQFAKPEEFAGFVERYLPGKVIADCLPLVKHLLAKADIEVRLEDQATRFVFMNRTELQQVMVNLIVNAIHAMPDGGTLTLSARDADWDRSSGVEIVVRDTGVGMEQDVAARVFDPFFTTKRQDGTGLGLSISQTLVTRQGGSISVETGPGKGAAFSIWLPEAA
ncbi:cache domain-containing protein [Sinorhizobium numidicum]|uniref:histidine kinase n=1 Tax=Sinorhizobium numidicum TaxID=680248 RepID=A0ABY8CPY1_9HYPH|nr:cache domain-containing protein [Sinorhizobium numidicum]WEX73977.1 cache domain-containing protein [Sinorhizobium numidicum]WEX79962.1 cache domain-containing protein [Sinorhizobium numidicum]